MSSSTMLPSNPNMTFGNGTRPGFPPGGPLKPPMTTEEYVIAVLLSIVTFCILLENILVLVSFRVNRRLRTKTNYFILSLAFADLLIGILSVPYYVYVLIDKPRSNPFYPFWLATDVVIGVSSIMNLTMISLERAYALLRPIQHRNISKVVILIMIGLAWTLGVFAGSLYFILLKLVSVEAMQKSYGIIVFTGFFAIPLTIIIGTYSIIFKIASAHARGRGVRSFRKDLRIATTVAVVIGCFTINWLPFFSLNLFFTVCRYFGRPLCFSVPSTLGQVTKIMQYGNSMCNPLIYGFRNKDFKAAFKRIFYKLLCKDAPISTYTQNTYTTRHTKRMIRTDSSYEDSVIYPDQIVPPGMYDMRNSYRNAISRGARKKPAKNKPERKGLAQGLMSLNVQTFSMVTDDVNTGTSQLSSPSDVTTNSKQSEDVNCNTADNNDSKNGVQSSLGINRESRDMSRDKGDRESGQSKETLNVEGKNNSTSRVHFDVSNGVVNGGLHNEEEPRETADDLSISVDKERSSSVLTPNSPKDIERKVDRRSLTFT